MIFEYFSGFFSVPRAIFGINKYSLWNYFLISGIIGLAIGYGLFTIIHTTTDDLALLLQNWYPFEWGKSLFYTISNFFSAIFLTVLGVFMFKYLVMAFCSPVFSFVSEKVEENLLGVATERFSIIRLMKEILRGIVISLSNLSKEIFLLLLAFVLSAIFPIFSPVIAVVLFFVQAYYVGFSCMDYYFERRYGINESRNIAHENRTLLVGIGSAFIIISLVPILGWIFAPMLATIASTEQAIGKRL